MTTKKTATMWLAATLALCAATPLARAEAKPADAKKPEAKVPSANLADLQWKPKPALPPGAFGSVVYGEPEKGAFAFYGKFPASYTVPLHWHSNEVTVLMVRGAMSITPNEGAPVDTQEGGFFVLPAQLHYVARCDHECIFLVQGARPFDIIYAHASDDPRTHK
jgi:hypothetical protein